MVAQNIKKDVITKINLVLGQMALDVSKTGDDLKALSRFGDETGWMSTETTLGVTAAFVAKNQNPDQSLGGELPDVNKLKFDDYGLLSN